MPHWLNHCQLLRARYASGAAKVAVAHVHAVDNRKTYQRDALEVLAHRQPQDRQNARIRRPITRNGPRVTLRLMTSKRRS
jgi:hypothetical protein